MDQWIEIESTETNPHRQVHGQLIYEKGVKNICTMGKGQSFHANQTATCKRMKLDPYLTAYAKNQLKMDYRETQTQNS